MPHDDLADLQRRVAIMEQSIAGHLQGCGEQNKHRERWERQVDQNVSSVSARVNRMAEKISEILRTDARRMGYLAGATAAGSLLGGALVAVLARIFWGS